MVVGRPGWSLGGPEVVPLAKGPAASCIPQIFSASKKTGGFRYVFLFCINYRKVLARWNSPVGAGPGAGRPGSPNLVDFARVLLVRSGDFFSGGCGALRFVVNTTDYTPGTKLFFGKHNKANSLAERLTVLPSHGRALSAPKRPISKLVDANTAEPVILSWKTFSIPPA